ncbi:MAG: hypothetical protein A2017_15750 [Lentisphaerae bacterium GWF2_44_16]|nr:MAG: hypothetical protein A2017_15750 [Lentisphaerae bacterium GWF2_44_16]
MIKCIDKDDKVSLCVQLKNVLIDEIREGSLKSGKRIPGERVIANKYGVSRGTAVEALKLLEKDGYLERIATKGTFVAENVNERLQAVNILFPFPELSISKDLINYSNWVIDTETYSGLLDGASRYNVSINLQHLEASNESSVLMGQIKKVRNFDAVFFINEQHPALLNAIANEKIPYIVTDFRTAYSHPMTISYKRKKALEDSADYLVNCGYKTVGLLMNDKRDQANNWKMSYFQECLEKRNVKTDCKSIYHIPENEEKALGELLQMLPRSANKLPEVFFCEAMTAPLAFLRAAHERKWTVGKDIDIMGYAGETALRNTIPSITYLKIPYVEMGREACRLLYEKVTKKHNEIIHHEVPAQIIEGNSTRKIK